MPATRAAFLDANVLRGQLTTDIMLTLAHERLYVPQWSAEVLAEAGRNRPPGVTQEAINSRFARMNEVFPAAMTAGYEDLMPQMQADDKDRHVLAAAVHGGSDVLVTDNTKDFHPPTSGAHAMTVERTSEFLNKLLADHPREVVGALQKMVDRNRRIPRTMPELIDKMASQQDLKGFAHKLNAVVPAEQRGSHPNLQATRAVKAALDGVALPRGDAGEAAQAPEVRKNVEGPKKSADREL